MRNIVIFVLVLIFGAFGLAEAKKGSGSSNSIKTSPINSGSMSGSSSGSFNTIAGNSGPGSINSGRGSVNSGPGRGNMNIPGGIGAQTPGIRQENRRIDNNVIVVPGAAGAGAQVIQVPHIRQNRGQFEDDFVVVAPGAAGAGAQVIQVPHIRQNRGQFEDDFVVVAPGAAGAQIVQVPDFRGDGTPEDNFVVSSSVGGAGLVQIPHIRQEDRQLDRRQDNIAIPNLTGAGAVQAPDIRQEDRQLDRRQDRQLN